MEFGSPALYAELYGSNDLAVSWFPTILDTINSAVIEEIIFWLYQDDEINIDSSYWDDVVTILSTDQFDSLKRITFHISGDEDSALKMTGAVQERFDHFRERGLLHIDNKSDPDGKLFTFSSGSVLTFRVRTIA